MRKRLLGLLDAALARVGLARLAALDDALTLYDQTAGAIALQMAADARVVARTYEADGAVRSRGVH